MRYASKTIVVFLNADEDNLFVATFIFGLLTIRKRKATTNHPTCNLKMTCQILEKSK